MKNNQVIDLMTYDIYTNYLPRTRREKALVRLKHLPGRHNQQSHGRRRGGGGGGIGSASTSQAVAKFNDWNDREIARIEQTMERVKFWLVNPNPTQFTGSEIDLLQKMYVDMYGQNDKAQRLIISNAQRFGLSVEDAARLIRNRDIVKGINNASFAVDDVSIGRALLSDHYNEQRIRISRMSKDEQQQLLVEIDAKQSRTPWDYDRAAALTIYADPEVRWDAIRFMKKNENDASRMRMIAGKNVGDERMDVRSPMETMQFYSLDYRLYEALEMDGHNPKFLSYTQLKAFNAETSFDQFMRAFSFTHTSESTNNVLGAQIQYAVSQVGPNAQAPRPPSFFPRGVKTPQTNPLMMKKLELQYQKTQQRYAPNQTLELYRGQKPWFELGIPMGPWSDERLVALGFSDSNDKTNPGILNTTQMPTRYIFMDYNDPNWRTHFTQEQEYLITETAFVQRSRKKNNGLTRIFGNDVALTNTYDVTWTEKAMNAELPEPQSYLEQNYDIFYNYRVKPQTRREKALVRLKADFEARGNTPGRRWSAGAGEVISGNLARDEAGRFTSASGGGRARRAVDTTRQEILRSGGGGKKPKRSQQSPEQQQAQRQKLGADSMKKLGYEPSDFAIIDSSSPQSPDDPAVQRLIDRGFMEIVNGKAYPTTLGRRVAKAVSRGNTDAAQESIDRDIQKRADRAEQKRQKLQSQIDDLTDRMEEQSGKTKARTMRRIRRLQSELESVSTKSSESFSPPASVRSAAARGLELRKKFGRGGTMVGVARARDLSNGKSIPLATIKRMVSFFARHSVDERPNWSDPSNPTNGYIAHLLWGGDAGRSWANSISKRMDNET